MGNVGHTRHSGNTDKTKITKHKIKRMHYTDPT